MSASFATIIFSALAVAAQPSAPVRYRIGDTFDQEVVVSRRSAFAVLGVEVGSGAQYSFASTFAVKKVNSDGTFEATQTIRTAKLIDADADMRVPLAAALEKTQGTKFELTVSATGEVTALKGPKDPIHVLPGKDAPQTQSLRLWSLLDADAWKELAGLTFFRPEKPLKPGATWDRKATHDWGPLGDWRGKTVYLSKGDERGAPGVKRVEYAHTIYHRPPAAGADRDLPLKVLKAEFKPYAAGGVILYDTSKDKVTAAEEVFRVRGTVVVSVGGTEATVEMIEEQSFRLRVPEPKTRDLTGKRPPGPR